MTGHGEGYARIRLHFDPNDLVVEEQWYPEEMVLALQGLEDGFCTGAYEVVRSPAGECTTVNGVRICEWHLAPAPIPGISPLTQELYVNAGCHFNQGPMDCWTDPQGIEHCPENTETAESTCSALESDLACGFSVAGARGESGECYVFEDTYDCDCTVFKDEAMECKKAVGDIVDCCKYPGGVSLGEYITLLMTVGKLDSGIRAWEASTAASQALQGAWTTLSEPVHQTWSTVTQPFTSAIESIGRVGEVGVKQMMINETAKFVGNTFGAGAQSALFTNVGGTLGAGGVMEGGNFTLGGSGAAVDTLLNVVMTAYMVYQVTMILIQIIWECEEKEFELGARRELKNCHHIGSYCRTDVIGMCVEKREAYCCFNSPLSRIIQQQARPQLAMDWGHAEEPSCEGIPITRLSELDWDLIDLDEWLGILALTDNLPTAASVNMMYSMEHLTGLGNKLSTGSRPDTLTRTGERTEQVDVDSIRQDVGQDLWGQ